MISLTRYTSPKVLLPLPPVLRAHLRLTGCYVGQELMARSHFQGLVRKRLFPALIGTSQSLRSSSLFETSPFALDRIDLQTEHLDSLSTRCTDVPLFVPGHDEPVGKLLTWLAPSNVSMVQLRVAEYAQHGSNPVALEARLADGSTAVVQPLIPPVFPDPWTNLAK